MHNGKREGRPVERGLYAKHLKNEVAATVESNRTHPRLLEAREHIAPMVMVAQFQAERIEDGDGPTFRAKAIELVGRYQVERGKENGDPHAALRDLFDHIERGDAVMRAQMDLFDLTERIDKRASEAEKISLSKQNAIPGAKLEDLMTALVAALNAHVDEVKRKAVLADLSHTWGEPTNRVAGLVN